MRISIRHRGLFAAAILCSAASAQATYFSFASDVNGNGYTFAGTAGAGGSFAITDFSRPNTFNLVVDDNNGPLSPITIPVEFRASLTANNGQSTLLGGTLYQHSYRVSGSCGFYDSMGNVLLTLLIDASGPALLTVPGTQNAWSSVGAVLGSDSFAAVDYVATAAFVSALGGSTTAGQYGITAGVSAGSDDFGFDMTVLNAGSMGLSVALDPTSKLPTTTWRSESSFSGSALGGIPTPGAAGLMAAGMLMMFPVRRRRGL